MKKNFTNCIVPYKKEKKLYKVFKKLKYKPPIERLISLFQHIIKSEAIIMKLNESENFYLSETQKYSTPFFDLENDDIHIITKNPNNINKYNLDNQHYQEINEKIISYNKRLIEEINFVSKIIIDQYSLYKTFDFSKSLTSVINNESFIISPIFIPFKTWKTLVRYELEILKNKFHIERAIVRFKSYLIDLKYRLRYELIPNITYYNIFFGITGKEFLDELPPTRVSDFKNPIQNYIAFLDDIDINSITESSLKRTISQIKKEDDLRKKLVREKIKINPIYTLKTILNFFNETVINRKQFLILNTNVKHNSKLSDFDNSQIKLSREELDDFILLFKYLKEKEIVLSSVRIISKVIKNYTQTKLLSEESIRKLLSKKNKKELPLKIKKDLNYYLL